MRFDEWNPGEQSTREALCTTGNGYFATRGAMEEEKADRVHYPGTYLAGGYNRMKSEVAGKTIENEDLVNWPNWLFTTFRREGKGWFGIHDVEVLEFMQALDLHNGVFSKKIRFRDKEGRESLLESSRFVSMNDMHLAALQWTLTPLNWSGRVRLHTGIDGSVENTGVERYRQLNGRHLQILDSGPWDEETMFMDVVTRRSKIRMVQTARVRLFKDGHRHKIEPEKILRKDYVAREFELNCEKGKSYTIEKMVSLFTSRDPAIFEPFQDSLVHNKRLGDFEQALKSHGRTLSRMWERADILMQKENEHQLIVRLHIFHLLQTISSNTVDMDVGIPSRGLHGEAYRGHIFWDELFIFPYLNFHFPHIARALLMYRFRRMDEAKQMAGEAGFRGAMFPWQSGSNGREESQVIHLNPKSGRWIPDETHLQRHINSAIAFNVWQYFEISNDLDFLNYYAAEMILNIALLWSDIAHYNKDRDRYEIHGVVGPDEYHTRYPGAEEPGLKNNAYTNFMAAWVLMTACEIIEMLDSRIVGDLKGKLQVPDSETGRWKEIAGKMYIPFHEGKIISQFEGYEDLKEFNWEEYTEKYGDIMRLDRILEKENDSPNNYKASKQADVLMLFYLFSSDELCRIMNKLGYDFSPEDIPGNIEYYDNRTSNGSTLSELIHSWVQVRSDRTRSWKSFMNALMSDYRDIQGGTTGEGIHLGAMAGTVDLVQRCFSGLEVRDHVLWFNPSLPDPLKTTAFRIRFRGYWIGVSIDHENLVITLDHGCNDEIKIGVVDRKYTFSAGDSRAFDLKKIKPS